MKSYYEWLEEEDDKLAEQAEEDIKLGEDAEREAIIEKIIADIKERNQSIKERLERE